MITVANRRSTQQTATKIANRHFLCLSARLTFVVPLKTGVSGKYPFLFPILRYPFGLPLILLLPFSEPENEKNLCTKNFFFRIVPNTKSYGASYSRHTRKENFPIARNTHSLNCNEQNLECRSTLSLNCHEQNLGCRNTHSLNYNEQNLGCKNTLSLNCHEQNLGFRNTHSQNCQ